ncbi:hypothetical protein [Phenylobacterium montanum]|uniref:Uncharacterized protein n=1 Tax=Phenylobacterium montanum TaxID=2823693 RepID=A0A975IU29_9CAUL|nr:hypothetical protein [Caulobacter sp. S6]QUD87512.1 hypothetical protein KCG34_21045 [Caulobacter sp. S6]
MNPEFERNLWLELTPRRQVGLALTLGLILGAAWMLGHGEPHKLAAAMSATGFAIYIACGLIWTARAAGGSVLEEIRGRTWDFQRLSAISPWAMTWGKLFGAAGLAWIGALVGLFVGGAALAQLVDTSDAALLVLGLLAMTVFFQACAMGAALVGVRKARAEGRVATGGAVLVGVLGGLFLLSSLSQHLPGAGRHWAGHMGQASPHAPINVWGQEIDGALFAAASAWLFAAWAVVGAWRLMRLELQMKNSPWTWLAFLVFAAVWRAGLANPLEGGLGRALAGGVVLAGLTYAAAFVEPADPVRLRRFWAALHAGRLGEAVGGAPAALFALALTVLAAIAAMALPRGDVGQPPAPIAILAALVFLIRDLGVITFFRFGPQPSRGDLSTVIALVLLYAVGAVIDQTLGARVGVVLFSPLLTYAPLSILVSGVVQAAAAWVLASHRLTGPAPPPNPA